MRRRTVGSHQRGENRAAFGFFASSSSLLARIRTRRRFHRGLRSLFTGESPPRRSCLFLCLSLCPCRTKSNLNLVPTPAFASSSSLPSLRHGPMTGAFAALLDRGLYSSGAAYGVRFSSFTASLIGVSDCYCFFFTVVRLIELFRAIRQFGGCGRGVASPVRTRVSLPRSEPILRCECYSAEPARYS